MFSESRRRRFRERKIESSSVSPKASAIDGQRKFFMMSLRSSLFIFFILLLGYITWRTGFFEGDPTVSRQDLKFEESRRMKQNISVYSVEIVREYNHDPGAFTQGLLYAGNDTLFESTGLYGQSSVRKVHLQTGKVTAITKMESRFFGEGLTLLGERLFQVAWRTRTGFIYDRKSLKRLKSFTHQMDDGWGLANDGKIIFGSDGSSTLYHLDPDSMKVIYRTDVKYNGQSVLDLNELEFINGEVWANVWMTDCIARISPRDGEVLGWIFLNNLRESLVRSSRAEIDVLNGIAWDKEKGRIFVTGKLWPKLFEIKLQKIIQPLNATVESICNLRLL